MIFLHERESVWPTSKKGKQKKLENIKPALTEAEQLHQAV